MVGHTDPDQCRLWRPLPNLYIWQGKSFDINSSRCLRPLSLIEQLLHSTAYIKILACSWLAWPARCPACWCSPSPSPLWWRTSQPSTMTRSAPGKTDPGLMSLHCHCVNMLLVEVPAAAAGEEGGSLRGDPAPVRGSGGAMVPMCVPSTYSLPRTLSWRLWSRLSPATLAPRHSGVTCYGSITWVI